MHDSEEEEFHLSIKNNCPRKIVHVRNVFKDLTPYQQKILEYHKILAEKRKLAQDAKCEWQSKQTNISPSSPSEFTINLESRKKALRLSNDSTELINTPKRTKTGETRVELIPPRKPQSKPSIAKSVNFNDQNVYFSNISRNNLIAQEPDVYKTSMNQDHNIKYFYENKENVTKAKKAEDKRKEFNTKDIKQKYQQNLIYRPYKQHSGLIGKNENYLKDDFTKDFQTRQTKRLLEENLNFSKVKQPKKIQKPEYFIEKRSPDFDPHQKYYNNYSSYHQQYYQPINRDKQMFSNENFTKEGNNYLRPQKKTEFFSPPKLDQNKFNVQRGPLVYKQFLINNQFNNYAPQSTHPQKQPLTNYPFYKQQQNQIFHEVYNRNYYRY